MSLLLTWLYAPANRAERFDTALASGADAVIVDLEDAVDLRDKAAARLALGGLLSRLPAAGHRPYLQVRINGTETTEFLKDAELLRSVGGADSVAVPKIEDRAQVEQVAALLGGAPIHGLIETARGLENLGEICRSGAVTAVSLGEGDLLADVAASDQGLVEHARYRMVLACRAAGLPAPRGSAYLHVRDDDGLRADTARLAVMGFRGRAALHPRQLPAIRAAFRPAIQDYERALAIVTAAAATGTGAAALPDGTFIDRPVLTRAQQTVDLWRASGGDATRP